MAAAVWANIWTLKDGHNWGDDFAQYILNARNIAEGRPFMSGIMLDDPTIYPPGFPLLIAPAIKVWGAHLKFLKFYNIVFWYLAVLLVYFIVRQATDRPYAVAAALFLSVSSYFFTYKQNVLSDIPFFFFVCLSIYLFKRHKNAFFAAASAALWVRSAGVVLFAAALFHFVFVERNWKKAAATAAVLVLNECVLLFWMGWHPGFWMAAKESPAAFVLSALGNFQTTFQSLWYFLCPGQTLFSYSLSGILGPVVFWAAPLLFLLALVSFVRGTYRHSLSYAECFSFLYLCLIIFWSAFTMQPAGFTRFILPLIPFLFVGIWRLLTWMKRPFFDSYGWGRVMFLLLVFLNITNILINLDFNDDDIGRAKTRQMAAWVKEHTSPQEHFMFFKPRALALLTGRVGTAPRIMAEQDFLPRLKDFNISYVIVPYMDRELMIQLEKREDRRLVWQNASYQIYRLQANGG